jgi:hypothetical protein
MLGLAWALGRRHDDARIVISSSKHICFSTLKAYLALFAMRTCCYPTLLALARSLRRPFGVAHRCSASLTARCRVRARPAPPSLLPPRSCEHAHAHDVHIHVPAAVLSRAAPTVLWRADESSPDLPPLQPLRGGGALMRVEMIWPIYPSRSPPRRWSYPGAPSRDYARRRSSARRVSRTPRRGAARCGQRRGHVTGPAACRATGRAAILGDQLVASFFFN